MLESCWRFEKFTRTGGSLAKWTGVCWKIGSEDSAALEVSDGGRTPLEARPGTDERDNSIGWAQYKEHRTGGRQVFCRVLAKVTGVSGECNNRAEPLAISCTV